MKSEASQPSPSLRDEAVTHSKEQTGTYEKQSQIADHTCPAIPKACDFEDATQSLKKESEVEKQSQCTHLTGFNVYAKQGPMPNQST